MAKLKDLKEKNPKYTIDVIELLSKVDPTSTNKYVPFLMKIMEGWVDASIKSISGEKGGGNAKTINLVKDFEILASKNLLENSDIYSYTDILQIVGAVKEGKEHTSRSEIKKNETITLFEDEDLLIVKPLSLRSSKLYGSNTKWCTSSINSCYDKYFTQYTEKGNLIYAIFKKLKPDNDKLAKVAFHNYINTNDLTIWDVQDNKLSTQSILPLITKFKGDTLSMIYGELQNPEHNGILAKRRNLK